MSNRVAAEINKTRKTINDKTEVLKNLQKTLSIETNGKERALLRNMIQRHKSNKNKLNRKLKSLQKQKPKNNTMFGSLFNTNAPPPLPPRPSRGISTNSAMGLTRKEALLQVANAQSGVSTQTLRKNNTVSQLTRAVATGNANVQTLDAALRAKRVPNSIIRKMSLNNKRKYAQSGYRFKSGMFGGYRFEQYDPELNRRKTSAFALRSGLSKTKNIPTKVSSGFASLTKGIGRRLRESGEQRKARAAENIARREQARQNLRARYFGY